jgi:DNA-directed RNA polymerase specialized sigma subunit
MNFFQKLSALDLASQMRANAHFRQRQAPAPTAPSEAGPDNGDNDLDTVWKRWSVDRDPSKLTRMVELSRPIINSAVTSYVKDDSPLYRSRAKLMVAQALQSYKPGKDTKLRTWLMTNLQGLKRYATNSNPIVAPERVRYEAAQMEQAENEFREENGRPPTPDELADQSGFSVKRIHHVRRLSRPVVAEGQLVDKDDADSDVSYAPGVLESDWQNTIAEFVYHGLDPVNKQLYDMTVGRNGHKPLGTNEAAAALGISAAAVSQRKKRIFDQISAAADIKDVVA